MCPSDKEFWKYIPKTNKAYKISNFGRILSFKGNKPKLFKNSLEGQGYEVVTIVYTCRNKGYTTKVHILVGEAFVSNPRNLLFLNHKDGNKANNYASNLEYVTPSENVQHAYDTGLTRTIPVAQYKNNKFIKEYKSISEASKQTGINSGSIHYAMTGKCSHGKGYTWKKV